VVLSLCLGAPYLIALWAGVRFFHYASDVTYRRIAYGIVAASALVSVPLFDKAVSVAQRSGLGRQTVARLSASATCAAVIDLAMIRSSDFPCVDRQRPPPRPV
jgi:hypothetical protein